MSEADKAAIATDLADYAESNGVKNPPEIAIVRVVDETEWPETYASCLTDLGFPAQVEGDGVAMDIPQGQEDAQKIASYTCLAKYPIDPNQDRGNLTDAQKEVVYVYVTQTLVPCLEENGYDIENIPSKTAFIEGYGTPNAWNPYFQIADQSFITAEGKEIETLCPANAPAELLF